MENCWRTLKIMRITKIMKIIKIASLIPAQHVTIYFIGSVQNLHRTMNEYLIHATDKVSKLT